MAWQLSQVQAVYGCSIMTMQYLIQAVNIVLAYMTLMIYQL